jgi:hypothetical protein
MTEQALFKRNGYTPQNKLAPFNQSMNIISHTDAHFISRDLFH